MAVRVGRGLQRALEGGIRVGVRHPVPTPRAPNACCAAPLEGAHCLVVVVRGLAISHSVTHGE